MGEGTGEEEASQRVEASLVLRHVPPRRVRRWVWRRFGLSGERGTKAPLRRGRRGDEI